jgi:hypothetical protein
MLLPLCTSLPLGDGNLMDLATKAWHQHNMSWLLRLATQIGRIEFAQRSLGKDRGMRYRLYDVILATPLTPHTDATSNGPLCGNNGGRTQKNQPCRRPGVVELNGRCRQHSDVLPAGTNDHQALQAGAVVPKLTLDFGHCDRCVACLPVRRLWAGTIVFIEGQAMLAPMLDASPQPLELFMGDLVFSDLFAQVKAHLWHAGGAIDKTAFELELTLASCPPPGHSCYEPPPPTVLLADRCWTVGGLRQAYGLTSELCLVESDSGRVWEDNSQPLARLIDSNKSRILLLYYHNCM